MAGFTLNGKQYAMDVAFRDTSQDTNMYVALVTSATAPAYNTTTLGTLTEIAAGNGYTSGGYSLTPNTTDFDVSQAADTDDWQVQIKDVTWSASGGSIPDTGNGARYAVLTDDNGTVGSRVVYAYWDLSTDRSVTDGNDLTLQNLELRLNET